MKMILICRANSLLLLLFVRVNSAEEEARAVEIMSRHEGFDARVIKVEAK